MDISEEHKKSKKGDYWGDLSIGSTTQYKTQKIEELIRRYFPPKCISILDIGSGGNCDHILRYRDQLGAERIACLDYDEKIIEQMKRQFPNEGIQWHVADIFGLQGFRERFDLVFLLDVLHEVYSFHGRSLRDPNEPIDSRRGLEYIVKAMENISGIVNPGGGIIITDNILPGENQPVKLRIKNTPSLDAVDYFLRNYPSRRFEGVSRESDLITIRAQDLSVLLTQYNKIKKEDLDRWRVERLEQHQYMTQKQYEEMFSRLGFKTHMIIETPDYVKEEQNQDFEIINGLTDFPKKRVTLLAIKG